MSSVESVVTTSYDANDKLEEQVKFIENTNKAFMSIIKSLDESIPVPGLMKYLKQRKQ